MTEFPNVPSQKRGVRIDEHPLSARVDLPATRRYSPESFATVAEYGHDQGH